MHVYRLDALSMCFSDQCKSPAATSVTVPPSHYWALLLTRLCYDFVVGVTCVVRCGSVAQYFCFTRPQLFLVISTFAKKSALLQRKVLIIARCGHCTMSVLCSLEGGYTLRRPPLPLLTPSSRFESSISQISPGTPA